MTDTLTIPFTARDALGRITAQVAEVVDPTAVGQVSDAAGFPVCRASVDFELDGYDGLLGWVQLVGTATEASGEPVFTVDPLEVMEGADVPFAFYGLEPRLFDAPYRSDRSRRLDWLAHSFLCFAPSRPMAREVQAVAGFSWGFVLSDGVVTSVHPEVLGPADWSRHLEVLSESFPTWAFGASGNW